jgi:LmbE family N-acetylglucosaminyl deacetylase
MKLFISCLLLFFTIVNHSVAQIPETPNASEILLQMKKLNVLGSVLYIAAHPDDENTRLLAWLSNDKLYRTGYLSLTRGDGGQNLIGDEQGIELGLIRTQELLAARRVDGADQFFSRAYDFGFTKTTDEALKIWNQQKILSDVVWIIRQFQPDIIITRFPEDKRAGHGQHSASSVLAHLAFSAAADPKQFPEQFKFGVKPWQARRLFLNTFRFGSVNTTSEDQMKIDVGGFNPLTGKSYGEIAADSRSQHRSQGFGVAHSRGNFLEYFSQTEGQKADSSLMQNVNCNWTRIPGGEPIGILIDGLIRDYNPSAPYKSLPALITIYKKIFALPEGYWRDEKLKETVQLIRDCSGLWLEATVPEGYAIKDQTIPVTLRLVNRAPVQIQLNSVGMNHQDTAWSQNLQTDVNYAVVRQISLRNLPVSQPYWLVEPMSAGSYNVNDQVMIGRPQNPPALEAEFNISFLGESFIIRQQVFFKYTDAVKGELFEPLTIVPKLMAYCDPNLMVFTKDMKKQIVVTRQWKTTITDVDGSAVIRPAGLSIQKELSPPPSVSITPVPGFEITGLSDSENDYDFLMKSDRSNDLNSSTWAITKNNGTPDTLLQCRTISYEHIPRIDYFRPAKSTIVSVNLTRLGKRIGYIEGAGDRVPDALTAMGYTVVPLNENGVTATGLQNLDAVVTGLRAYDVHDWLAGKYNVLMEYVKKGGNLIVQYNRNRGNDTTGIGPYPFAITNARVTEEDAPVHFIQPENAVLQFPNKITAIDFEGWVQERGIYFAQRIDPRYQKVLSMHDSGEPDQEGSLIVAHYGTGTFAYTGLVFFRELPAGVPGAYRLLANLIALNQPRE